MVTSPAAGHTEGIAKWRNLDSDSETVKGHLPHCNFCGLGTLRLAPFILSPHCTIPTHCPLHTLREERHITPFCVSGTGSAHCGPLWSPPKQREGAGVVCWMKDPWDPTRGREAWFQQGTAVSLAPSSHISQEKWSCSTSKEQVKLMSNPWKL